MIAGGVVYSQFDGFNDFSDKTVLDFGCGSGGKTLAYAINSRCKKIYGVDSKIYSGKAIGYAAENNVRNIEFIEYSSSFKIPLESNSVDFVISSSTFEHLEYPEASIQEIYRVLKPGGLLLNRWQPYYSRFGGHLDGIIDIPFAHVLLSDKRLKNLYENEAKRKLNNKMYLSDMMHLNKITLSEMESVILSSGLFLKSDSYYLGIRKLNFIKWLPKPVRSFFVDYHVHVFEK